MVHIWVIALYITLVLRDMLKEPLGAGWFTRDQAALLSLAPMSGLALVVVLYVTRQARLLDEGRIVDEAARPVRHPSELAVVAAEKCYDPVGLSERVGFQNDRVAL